MSARETLRDLAAAAAHLRPSNIVANVLQLAEINDKCRVMGFNDFDDLFEAWQRGDIWVKVNEATQ